MSGHVRCAWLAVALVASGCAVKVSPRYTPLAIDVKSKVRAGVSVRAVTPPPPVAVVTPPAVVYTEPVDIYDENVVEFFGIPLEGAVDVVFVLDRSGSMTSRAQGRLAELVGPRADPVEPEPGAEPAPPDAEPIAPDPGAEPPDPEPPDAEPPDAEPADAEPADAEPADAEPADAEPVAPAIDPAAPPPPPAPLPPTKIAVARAELISAINRLPAGTRVNILFFNDSLEAFAPALTALAETGRDDMVQFVRATTADGATALAPAMRTAFLMGARRVVLLSDGLGNVGGDARDVLRDAREAMRGGVRIDTIGLGDYQDRELLETLARESRGLYQGL